MNSPKLTLHCGAELVTREQLFESPTPTGTDSWTPVAHGEFINLVEAGLKNANMRVMEECHALGHEGNRIFSLLSVSNCKPAGEDYSYVLGLRNSHDKSFPGSLAAGARVFVCDNLAFSGEVQITRRHTKNIMRDLPILVGKAIGLLAEKWTEMNTRIDLYKTTEINDRDAHDFMIRALEAKVAPVRQLDTIMKEWKAPRHPEFATSKNAWRLYNAFTEAAKEGALDMLTPRTILLHGLMDSQVGYRRSGTDLATLGVTDAAIVQN